MKFVYCTCNVSVREPLLKELERNRVEEYQVVEDLMAKPLKGDPRFNTSVWPGYNSAILMQFADDRKAEEVLAVLKKFNATAYNQNELVTVCMWTLDAYFSE